MGYHIISKNTVFYVVSTKEDKVDQQVDTKPGSGSIPPNSVLTVDPPIRGTVTVSTIRGVNGLYVTLKGSAEKTKLTWSNERYTWVIRATGSGAYYVTPADGADLYWFDEFSAEIGNHVEVRAGKEIRPPQGEWTFTENEF